MKKSSMAIIMAGIMLMTIGSVCCTVSADEYEKNGLPDITLTVTLTDYGHGRLNDDVIGHAVKCQGKSGAVYKENGQYKAKIEGLDDKISAVSGRWSDIDIKVSFTPVILGHGLFIGDTDERDSEMEITVGVQKYRQEALQSLIDWLMGLIN